MITDRQQSVQMNSCTYGVCPPDPKAYNETEYWAERITNGGEFVHENPATVGVQGHSQRLARLHQPQPGRRRVVLHQPRPR